MSIGSALNAARTEAGLSIEDVATSTRIRGTLIRQIEADNFEPCGGAIYARGHIRNVAVAVGIDPAPLIAEFDVLQGPAGGVPAHEILDRPEIVQRTRTGPNWTAAMLVTAILLAAVAFVSLLTGPGSGSTPPTAGGARTTAPTGVPQVEPSADATDNVTEGAVPSEPVQAGTSTQPAAPTTVPGTPTGKPTRPAQQPATSPPPAVVAFSGVNVRVSITGDRSWVLVRDLSGVRKVLYQGVLERGVVRDFTTASKISLTLGNAGAVALTVNGRSLGAAGGPGQVVTLPFGPGDPGAG